MAEQKKSMKQMVNRADWQSLRKSFLGTWKETPSKNISKIRTWLGPLSNAEDEKLRIAMNYLTGTGFRTGRIKHPAISKLRTDISVERRRRKFKK